MNGQKAEKDIVVRLRDGEHVKCPECGKGVLMPFGDYKTTPRFTCSACKLKVNIN